MKKTKITKNIKKHDKEKKEHDNAKKGRKNNMREMGERKTTNEKKQRMATT